ncbi:hypothetical protein BOKEGFJH_00171 [Chlamydia avium]|uniref:Uncharacterized protein n=2 Tax=Chlamydia avium TaxID=1457141 RepID=W8JFS1_9CHLA|nr:hypothetical protein [Chlamydia avium]AHK63045.1 Uncharacterized protein M832_01760 [Chlamydia avium 10DC88]EPP35993.1 hypothetical protein CP10743SC13_0499 [Chlamydia psittaci 10_743_SC13]EPP38073.1 hypothetical protein CP10881SC42_0584 [Chlamydia avium]VVT42661.1 hypothetical protein BOKEGFJH_00171 [Chlamydia avium]
MIRKFFVFFFRLFFPVLCYGCRFPGEILCSRCLEILKIHKCSGRCPHCFSFLGLDDISTCKQCLPSFSRRSFHLYSPSSEALSLYSQACGGKIAAIAFFTQGIRRQWAWQQVVPMQIIYIISKIPKEFAKQLHKETGIPYRGIFLEQHLLVNSTKDIKRGPICILSSYPLSRKWQNLIERCVSQSVILISLFVDPQEDLK